MSSNGIYLYTSSCMQLNIPLLLIEIRTIFKFTLVSFRLTRRSSFFVQFVVEVVPMYGNPAYEPIHQSSLVSGQAHQLEQLPGTDQVQGKL